MRRSISIFVSAWLLGTMLAGAQEPAAQAPLESCAAVRALSREQSARGLPVRLRGVVTLIPYGASGAFTIDDGTGLWVSRGRSNESAASSAKLQVGDLVEISGRSRRSGFTPIATADEVRVLGRVGVPRAQTVLPIDLQSGLFACQRVSTEGVVQKAEQVSTGAGAELRLVISTRAGRFIYTLLHQSELVAKDLVDSKVSLAGVALSLFNARGQFLGPRILSNDPEDLRILTPAATDPFEVPETTLDEVIGFSPQGLNPHRQRVRGTVTLCEPGRFLYVQDKGHALRITSHQADRLEPGDLVEASGFFVMEQHNAVMQEAVLRRIGHTAPPAPLEVTREQVFQHGRGLNLPPRDYNDYLVTLHVRLLDFERRQGEPLRLSLDFNGELVSAELSGVRDADAVTDLRPGSELMVSGVCALTFSESSPVLDWPQPVALRLLLRGTDDIRVIRASSWWTPPRLQSAIGVLTLGALAFLAWVILLRRTVAKRSAALAESMRARRDAAVEFETTLRERNRLAADLHDTLEQTLTGLTLQLEASEGLQTSEPARSRQHLTLAQRLLARSREDLRRSIWNLRANPLENHSLEEALREVAAERGAGTPVRIVVAVEGTTRHLPDLIAGNMFMIAHEGITNALKHANPREIELRLAFAESSVALWIRDDGCGFDSATVAGAKDGHFGLQGMDERVVRLGGRLEIRSVPGKGTSIGATVPIL